MGALVALGLALAAGGCAAGSSTTSSGSSSTPSAVGLGAVSTPSGGSGTASGSAAGSASTSGPAVGASSGPALAPSRGYGTYELCQGHCTGAVPAALHRPLRLPRLDGGPCPVTVHPTGPVTPSSSTEVGFATITGSRWLGAEVTWMANRTYSGPLLIRGGQVGGGGGLGFGEGRVPYDALQLLQSGRVSPRVPAGVRAWTTYTRIRRPGCYAYQVDGTNFTESDVFRAVG